LSPIQPETAPTPVKVGDFFYSSWGYDQTNVDFYEVLSLSASGKTAKVRQVATFAVSETANGSSVRVAPIPGSVHPYETKTLTKRIKAGYQGRPSFYVASYATAYLWDCTPKHETGTGWGH
jgi:hypothetical protein